jgi:hypothetical protein
MLVCMACCQKKIHAAVQGIDYSDGVIKGKDDKGNVYKTTLTAKQKELVRSATAIDFMSLIGLSGASVSRLTSQVQNQIKQQKSPVKFHGGVVHNKNSGSEKTK